MHAKALLIVVIFTIGAGFAVECRAAKRGIRVDAPGFLCDVKEWTASSSDVFSALDGNLDGNQDSANFFAPGSSFYSYITLNGPAVFCTPNVYSLQDMWEFDGAQDPANPASLPDPNTGLPTTLIPDNVAVAAQMYYWPSYTVANDCSGLSPNTQSDCNDPVFEVIVWTLTSGSYEFEFDAWPCQPDPFNEFGGAFTVAPTVVPSFSWGGTIYTYTDTCANFNGNDLLIDPSGVAYGFVVYNGVNAVPMNTVESGGPPGWTANFATTTTITVSPQFTVPGTLVTVTATVNAPSSNAPIPTTPGTVTFYDGGTAIQSNVPVVWTNGQGVATYGSSGFQAGTHSLTATFSGISNPPVANSFVANFQTSTSAALQLSIGPAPTVTIAATPSTITLGQSSNLTWSSTNATTCTASGTWFGSETPSGTLIVSPQAVGTYPYALTCAGPGGTISSSATLTVTAAPAPSVFVSVSPSTITLGQSAMVTWSSTNATTCVANSAWSGNQSTSGSLTVTPGAAGGFAYSLTCTGTGGTGNGAAALIVNPAQPPPPSAPTVTVGISPGSITVGQSAMLTWSSTNATACTADSAWSGGQATSGTLTVSPASAGGYAYSLTCTGAGGAANGAVALVVSPAPPPASDAPTVTISISPTTITIGQSATLTWSSTNATSCVADSAWTGAQPTSGTLSVTPTSTGGYAYSLSCTGAAGTMNDAVGLAVVAAPATTSNTGGKSGGGGVDIWEVLGLAGVLWLRRRQTGRVCRGAAGATRPYGN